MYYWFSQWFQIVLCYIHFVTSEKKCGSSSYLIVTKTIKGPSLHVHWFKVQQRKQHKLIEYSSSMKSIMDFVSLINGKSEE